MDAKECYRWLYGARLAVWFRRSLIVSAAVCLEYFSIGTFMFANLENNRIPIPDELVGSSCLWFVCFAALLIFIALFSHIGYSECRKETIESGGLPVGEAMAIVRKSSGFGLAVWLAASVVPAIALAIAIVMHDSALFPEWTSGLFRPEGADRIIDSQRGGFLLMLFTSGTLGLGLAIAGFMKPFQAMHEGCDWYFRSKEMESYCLENHADMEGENDECEKDGD